MGGPGEAAFSFLDRAARAVRARYPAIARNAQPEPLGNRGGFSGARLWRIDTAAGPACLRAWPAHETPARLTFRHRLMTAARPAGLSFVPSLFSTADGVTWVECAGRLWECAEWLPGRADFHDHPTPARLHAACSSLARLHAAWAPFAQPVPSPCPAVRRRLDCLRAWQALLDTGWHPLRSAGREDPLRPVCARAFDLLARWTPQVPPLLARWERVGGPVQPCLCDVWHDHLLFTGEELTGLVDYGAVKPDHVAVDLARLLGSLVEDDVAGWQEGLRAYRTLRPLSVAEEELAHDLDRTGTLLGLSNWLRWLYAEGRAFEDREAAGRRLEVLVRRVERWDAVG